MDEKKITLEDQSAPLPTNDMDVTNVRVKEEKGDAEDAEKEVISLSD